MPMPDVGLAPPPPVDVAAQMRPNSGAGAGAPAPDLGSILQMLAGSSAPQLTDVTPKVLDIEPYLEQLARQVPALGPDVDRLNVELQSRMGGLPAALSGLAGGAPGMSGPLPGTSTPGAPNPAQPNPGMPQGPMAGPAAMPQMPANPLQTMGALDVAMQIEMKLPAIGKDDPTLMPFVQGFIARMREEVPKVVGGETEAVQPPPQPAPTDQMTSRIPVSY